MKIKDFYQMPSIKVDHAWFYYRAVEDIFNLNFNIYDYREDDSRRLLVERKLSKNIDGERGVTYNVLTFDGVPFCLLIQSGRGWNENSREYITCEDTFNLARKYVLDFLSNEKESITIISDDIDRPEIGEEYGCLIYLDTVTNTTKLVEANCFVEDGDKFQYVLDENEMREAFEKNVRSVYNNFKSYEQETCIKNPEMMTVYRKSIMDTLRLPDEDKIIIDNGEINIIGAVRYHGNFYYVEFPPWYQHSSYIGWILNERLTPICAAEDLILVSNLFEQKNT
ncbi:MAG: hypothetical protein [Caudoviricetes sp.]|nr:MAG: hypothetical protein [Caudoviricetes sp.]